MGIGKLNFKNTVSNVFKKFTFDEIEKKLGKKEGLKYENIKFGYDSGSFGERLKLLKLSKEQEKIITGGNKKDDLETYGMSIENYIGTAKMPVGIAGPIIINGSYAQGEYYVPMATTEAAMLASYTRGSQLISEIGGCSAFVLSEGVSRCPCFCFKNMLEVGKFLLWLSENEEKVVESAESTSRYARIRDMNVTVEGNRVYLNVIYTTGDAAGQNMVTIATEKACEYIEKNSVVKPEKWYVEANMSGDKKASSQSFQSVRGKKVVCEAVIPKELLKKRLNVTAREMEKFYQVTQNGGIQSGVFGNQGHYANALAGIYIACGQDAACVSESSVGLTRFEALEDGSLYASVTLPNLIVGTVGGGTMLPTQKTYLEILGVYGAGNANKFAEIVAGMCLAGELSISAAICSNNFTRAHKIFSRIRNKRGQ
jgi:hydroxymethylglutaryl-CoA reductase (NADPH)